MSPAEKRYFKRHYGSESNTLTHLYDAINLQKDYDEDSIKEQFTGKVAVNLKVYKFQLEQLLLKSLASHRHFSTIGSKIRLGLEHFEILLEKNLLKMAEKQLGKTKQVCLDNEKFAYLPVILAKEAKLYQIRANGFSSTSHPIHEEVEFYTKKMMVHYQQSSKLNALIDLYRKNTAPLSKSELKTFLEKLDLQISENQPTAPIKDRLLTSIMIGMKHLLTGAYQLANTAFAEVIEFFKKNGSQASHFAHFYLNSLYGAIDANFILKDYTKVREYLKTGKQFCEKNELYYPKLLHFAAYEAKLSIFTGTADPFLKKQLPKYEAIIEEMDLEEVLSAQLFYGWAALSALFADHQELAQTLVRKIQDAPIEERPFMTAFGRMLEFVVYFETPNFQKITQFLDRIKQEKKIKLSDPDKLFFGCFLKFADQLAIDPRSAKELAQQFLEKLDQLPKGPLLKVFQKYELHRWLEAIVSESAFLETLSREKAH
jgi:hypothetical protein